MENSTCHPLLSLDQLRRPKFASVTRSKLLQQRKQFKNAYHNLSAVPWRLQGWRAPPASWRLCRLRGTVSTSSASRTSSTWCTCGTAGRSPTSHQHVRVGHSIHWTTHRYANWQDSSTCATMMSLTFWRSVWRRSATTWKWNRSCCYSPVKPFAIAPPTGNPTLVLTSKCGASGSIAKTRSSTQGCFILTRIVIRPRASHLSSNRSKTPRSGSTWNGPVTRLSTAHSHPWCFHPVEVLERKPPSPSSASLHFLLPSGENRTARLSRGCGAALRSRSRAQQYAVYVDQDPFVAGPENLLQST